MQPARGGIRWNYLIPFGIMGLAVAKLTFAKKA
jgi:hypothetical protein